MAFSFTKTDETVAGSLRFTMGTFANAGGSTGGNVYTGLQKVQGMKLSQKGTGVVASDPVVNETLPVDDPVTIVTAANVSGTWLAWGI